MRITTYEMWKYFTYSHPKLMRAVEGKDINQAREALWDYNEDLFSRGRPEIPDITSVFLHFLKRWGDTKMIYNVNTDLYKELTDMELREDEEIPVEFLRLPYDAFSFQFDQGEMLKFLRDIGKEGDTFLGDDMALMITSTEPGEIHSCRCLVAGLTSCIGMAVTVLPLIEGGTVGDCLREAETFMLKSDHWIAEEVRAYAVEDFSSTDFQKYFDSTLKSVIQMLLYINSVNADVEMAEEGAKTKAERKEIKREKEKTGVEVRNVGYHIGTLIKNQKARGVGSGRGGRKRSHLRRAHWHHYWVGKRDGERQLILKWVLATAIHPEGLDELPTIVKMRQPSVLTEA